MSNTITYRLKTNRKGHRRAVPRWGDTAEKAKDYLNKCGPSTVRDIAFGIKRSISAVRSAMKNDEFMIVDYIWFNSNLTAVWSAA